MATSTVFTNNRTQAVRLPADLRFPDRIKQVNVRAIGNERIISPLSESWDSFFLRVPAVSQDFMETRATQEQSTREAL
jgi:antitoxin VapB